MADRNSACSHRIWFDFNGDGPRVNPGACPQCWLDLRSQLAQATEALQKISEIDPFMGDSMDRAIEMRDIAADVLFEGKKVKSKTDNYRRALIKITMLDHVSVAEAKRIAEEAINGEV